MADPATLRQLRSVRTRASNNVRRSITHMLTGEAPFLRPDGLPSWWPFWSDVLVDLVHECVAAARTLAAAEGQEQP